MVVKCDRCGKRMKKHNGWDDQYKCDSCNIITIVDDEYSYENVYGDIPEGCKTCGNSFYPDCRNSCNLYDE